MMHGQTQIKIRLRLNPWNLEANRKYRCNLFYFIGRVSSLDAVFFLVCPILKHAWIKCRFDEIRGEEDIISSYCSLAVSEVDLYG
jgi:hypothetical protein